MTERLQKLISAAGIASRRDAEALIEQGRVTINGKRAELGDKADPAVDDVRVDGERITASAERVYIMLNKPRQVVTTVRAQSQDERETVRDLVPVEGYLYPVGRLDADSEGLVLLTNDGELAERLTHPRYRHAKVYQVTVQGHMPDDALDIWRRGVVLDDGRTAPAEVKVVRRESRFTQLQVTMHEGRKRQIRRIGNTLGYPVESIRRTHLATLELGDLKPGEWRYLTDAEVRTLRASALSGPALDEPSRPSAGAVRGQRQMARNVPRTGYKRGEPGRRETESRASRGPSRGPRRPFRRDEGSGPDRPARPARRRADSFEREPRADRGDRGDRNERGPAPERRPFRTRRDTGTENAERRDNARPYQRPEGGDRPARPRRPDFDRDQRDQGRERSNDSRPPRGPRSGPPNREPRDSRGPDRGPRRESDRGGSGRPGGPGPRRGGRPGGRPGGGTGGPGRSPGSRGPGGGTRGSGDRRDSGGDNRNSGGSGGSGGRDRSGGRGPRRGGR